MTALSDTAFDATARYILLEDGGAVESMVLDDSFWADMRSGKPKSRGAQRFLEGSGWLATTLNVTADSTRWERHTLGGEMLILLSGALDVVMEGEDGTETAVELRPGGACLVGQGVWHRFVMREPAQFLGIAYGDKGKGTVFRAVGQARPANT